MKCINLKEDGDVADMAPKVGDWVTTVTSACLQSKMMNIIIITKNDDDKHYHHHHHNHIIHYHNDAYLSFQDPLTSRVWTRFALLLLPSLVADGRPDRHLVYGDDDGADCYDDDFTAAPLGRTQRLVQTRTPRQDFFKIFTCDCNV